MGLLVSNFYFFQESSKLRTQIIEDNDNFTKEYASLSEINSQYEREMEEILEEIKSLEALLSEKGEELSYINNENQFELEPQFDLAPEFQKDVATVWQDNRRKYINRKGKIIWDFSVRIR